MNSAKSGAANRLQSLASHRPLNNWFMEIVRYGTGKTFNSQDNQNWLAVTRPFVEAFFTPGSSWRWWWNMAGNWTRHARCQPGGRHSSIFTI